MMASIVSEVLILLLFAVPSTAWRTSSGTVAAGVPRSQHHQQWQPNNQLQQRSRSPHYSTTGTSTTTCTKSSCVLLLATASVPVYDDFISREDWQALSQEDRNRINEKRRLANPDSEADSEAAPPPTATTVKTTTTTTATTVVVADRSSTAAPSNASSINKDDNDGRRYQGVVKWFNMRKGFGFVIREDNQEDIFVHQTSIQSDGFRGLSVGDTVEFAIETIGERTAAVHVTKPGGAKLKEVNNNTPVVTAVAVVKTETTMAAATPPAVTPSEQAVRDLINASMF
mmetsp:Transcript_58558/g.66371  ORF Transcript_58558/g.66371 Transcript_58558/m.66371 type:complete len:285 (+) Transcript_58558:34-888(+)